MASIDMHYSIKDKVLLISCSHNVFNASMGAQLAQAAPTISLNATDPINNDADLKEWLKEQFETIKTHPDYNSVKRVVYLGDVNLNHSGKEEFPMCLRDNFIKNQFSPRPVEKVLFSANQSIVDRARTLNIPDTTVIITPNSGPEAKNLIKQIQENKMPVEEKMADNYGLITEENEEMEDWAPPENAGKPVFKGEQFKFFNHDNGATRKPMNQENREERPDSPKNM
ncbi:Uncharacterised protein [Legionella beliardensis]|uniref:Uncharacterized protein n=1 Tax=Legionella beliardensis TaxID=91822 RepID=A0A378I8Y5_9GAMM|nr:hypothetical protein [Legionella beliardensis]STX28834.1 Uncharacterised protein [Legionella beliardensis]